MPSDAVAIVVKDESLSDSNFRSLKFERRDIVRVYLLMILNIVIFSYKSFLLRNLGNNLTL